MASEIVTGLRFRVFVEEDLHGHSYYCVREFASGSLGIKCRMQSIIDLWGVAAEADGVFVPFVIFDRSCECDEFCGRHDRPQCGALIEFMVWLVPTSADPAN
jgi:hypothetical protein